MLTRMKFVGSTEAGRASSAGLWMGGLGLFTLALVVGVLIARPFHAASIAFDSESSALFFARIVSAHRLEVLTSTTSKPLLTLVFGALQATTHDWRFIAWATLLAFATGVVLMAEVMRRAQGAIAAAFVGVGLVGCGALLFDVGYALAIPWALAFVAAAGIALTSRPSRPALAGVLLMIGALARLEVLLVVGLAGLVLVWGSLAPRRWAGGPTPRREWFILLGLLALPIMCVHDLLLIGDPLYWSSVALRYSMASGYVILDPSALVGWLVGRLMAEWPLTLIGGVGFLRLVIGRRWTVAAAVLAFGPGMAAFLVLLAFRHIYVPDRYAAPIDIALIVAGGAGVAWALHGLTGFTGARVARLRVGDVHSQGKASTLITLTAVAALAVAVAWPGGFLDSGLRSMIGNSLALAADTGQVESSLRKAVDVAPASVGWPPPTSGPAAAAVLMVPTAVWPRMSLDLHVPLTRLRITSRRAADPAAWLESVGQIIFHDRVVDGPMPALEVDRPTPFGGGTVVPVQVDSAGGYWVVAVVAR